MITNTDRYSCIGTPFDMFKYVTMQGCCPQCVKHSSNFFDLFKNIVLSVLKNSFLFTESGG